MNLGSKYWMDHVVSLAAAGAPGPSMRVGVALVSAEGALICSAFEGEEPGESWQNVVRRKMRERAARSAHSLYLTINTLLPDGTFALASLLEEIECKSVYVGLPDPSLNRYLDSDPVTTRAQIARFPDDLQRKILDQNRLLYEESQQRIQCNPHYHTHRIGVSIQLNLNSHGLSVSRKEIDANRTAPALASLIREKHGIGHGEAARVVRTSLSEAFDVKYGSYEDAHDARSAHPNWVEDFATVRDSMLSGSWRSTSVINVGVGSGSEAAILFSDCTEITFVDIAERGLKNISESIPLAKTVLASADDLSELADDSYDFYVSLRTYNSSFFDTSAAASEAHRLLRPGGTIIVSVANGFLHTERDRFVVPGLIVPGTDFVDLYRGMDTARLVRSELVDAGFEGVQIAPASTEILLSGVAT